MAVNHKERNKRMTTMELDAFKARLIKDICMADTLEDVLRVAHGCSAEPDRPVKPYPAYQPDKHGQVREELVAWDEGEVATDIAIPGVPRTDAEVQQVLDRYFQRKAAGQLVELSEEEVEARIFKKMPWLQ